MFSKDKNEGRLMHSKSDNIEFMIYNNIEKVIKKPFQ